jgi:autotransporter-like protein/autochaperone domain-containing protein
LRECFRPQQCRSPRYRFADLGAGQFITLDNSGNLTSPDNRGIRAYTQGGGSPVTVTNTGNIDSYSQAIYARTRGGAVKVYNYGHITSVFDGILASGGHTGVANSPVTVINTGDIDLQQEGLAISANTYGANSKVYVFNSGALSGGRYGIFGRTDEPGSRIDIVNSGDIWAISTQPDAAVGIAGLTDEPNSPVSITNSGDIWATSSIRDAVGILSETDGDNSQISIHNSGDIWATSTGDDAYGISADAGYTNSPVTIVNSGDIRVKAIDGAVGIFADSDDLGSPISIVNSGDVHATASVAAGIAATGFYGPVTIHNSGSVFAQGPNSFGIYAGSNGGTTIVNSGNIGASSNLAIAVQYGAVDIFNTGTITGFVLLDADDRFINQAGGVFEARQTSDFDAYGAGGNDLFRNEAGGTVHAVNENGQPTRFVNLERFENTGLISLVDGDTNDSFTLSNTPGGTDLAFAASGNSTLAVDAFLGGPGKSSSDTLTIEGSVSGVTTVAVNNLNQGPGVFNPSGIRVVTATGATPNPDAFTMDPVDTGFFDYDLFFTPTGSGFWELRSFPGGGAYLLPQLLTAAQDIWHQSSSTWFDRTADLRVLMAGGAAPTAYDPGGKNLSAGPYPLTPAVWARASGSWLDRDDSQRATAYGRNYTFDLDRDLDTIDFQVGVDMGKRDVWGQGDALVFGLLGGFVHGDLDYDALVRNFDFDGGQVGAYATYLNGGLFVDTLLNAHLYSLETETLGFPSSLDANTIGLRTDTGYRFGSFSGGPFIEPLATLEVMWADIDGFSLGGNTVTFDDDANVRGRLGLRAGTTMQAWEGTLMEPFVIGSLWGNLTDDNQATLVSTGRTFRFEDQLEDVWGEVSAGVNFFNFSQTTAVFAKVDVSFGDDLTGVGGKAGMRVNW